MKNALLLLSASYLVLGLTSCVTLDDKLVNALAKDDASFCASTDIRGGVGSVVGGAGGGYGQSTLSFCRSNHANATVTLKPDGEISITHE